jgi:hypothetical protein
MVQRVCDVLGVNIIEILSDNEKGHNNEVSAEEGGGNPCPEKNAAHFAYNSFI